MQSFFCRFSLLLIPRPRFLLFATAAVAVAIFDVPFEHSDRSFFTFRKVVNRKNQTKRPTAHIYQESDYQTTLFELGMDKKSWLYVEQSRDAASMCVCARVFVGCWERNNSACMHALTIWCCCCSERTLIAISSLRYWPWQCSR